jgi:mannose-6-phosphate isomerase
VNGIYKLRNAVMNYAWGSPEILPRMLGIPNPDGKPFAELWMGTHPKAPSAALTDGGEAPLHKVAGRLPFLLKVIAVQTPLSVQVHPDAAQAKEGFAKEEAAGIPIDAAERNYRDKSGKPEIICALTPFKAMAGFRPAADIRKRLSLFRAPAFRRLLAPLEAEGGTEADRLAAFLRALFALTPAEEAELSACLRDSLTRLWSAEFADELDLTAQLAGRFTGDIAALSPLYLNIVTLNPKEALFVPAGTLHAYIGGAGIELMAASDNVVRAGLTAKHADRAEALRLVRFEPLAPAVCRPDWGDIYQYKLPRCGFSLVYLRHEEGEADFPFSRDAIIVCTEGRLALLDGHAAINIGAGESAYLAAHACRRARLAGRFTAFIASRT